MNKSASNPATSVSPSRESSVKRNTDKKVTAEGVLPITPHNQYFRETVESIVVAFILAFLFRAFVAEAFVIPTGSMAPTLMGAHKDLTCQQCGSSYQVGASLEFHSDSGARTGDYVVGSSSTVCRAVNAIDFQDPNQATFSGDRILVSKFDYVMSEPKRWDVIVFKFPEEARMNYIKRLVGLPGEDVMIREGDIYTKPHEATQWSIARKPPHKILAMRQPVADTLHTAPVLIKYNYPSLWQPWSYDGQPSHWKLSQTEDSWSAELTACDAPEYLRYFHKEVSPEQWLAIEQNKPLPEVVPTSSQLVTDYLAYNSFIATRLNNPSKYQARVDQLVEHQIQFGGENGMHWVGDLIGEFEIEVLSDTGQILLQLVELGIEYNLAIDLSNGEARLTAADASQADIQPLTDYLGGANYVVAPSNVVGRGTYRLTMANVDDQIVLWVNGRVAKFDRPAEFDSWQIRSDSQRRPYWLPSRPLDAAPIAIGGQAVSMVVRRAQVFRDLYYTAVGRTGFRSFEPTDFGKNRVYLRSKAIPEGGRQWTSDQEAVHAVYSTPQWWERTELFAMRQHNVYRLEEGQYFPLGDNSAQSSDARMWNQNFVEERFLLGKALLVFWPHTWNRPIPFTPNFQRMGLIR